MPASGEVPLRGKQGTEAEASATEDYFSVPTGYSLPLTGAHRSAIVPRASSGSPQQQAQVAQLVEQRTENPRVGGSIPSLGTTSPSSLTSPPASPIMSVSSWEGRSSDGGLSAKSPAPGSGGPSSLRRLATVRGESGENRTGFPPEPDS